MMRSHLSLESIHMLDMITRKGSFSAAAEALNKVPSALTYQIKKLEDELGVSLFDRSKQRAVLTASGQLILSQGRQILQASEQLYAQVQQLENGWESQLTISWDSIIPMHYLMPVLDDFSKLSAPTALSIREDVLGGGWDGLYTGRCGLVIGASGEMPKGIIATHTLGQVEFVFAVAPSHPLANSKGRLTPEQLAPYTNIVVSDTSQTLPARTIGMLNTQRSIRVPTMAAKKQAQMAGVGIGFLPRHLIDHELASGTLIAKDIYLQREPQTLYLAWKKQDEGRALGWLIERLQQVNWALS